MERNISKHQLKLLGKRSICEFVITGCLRKTPKTRTSRRNTDNMIMPTTEIHKVLDDLTWDQVEELAKTDSAIGTHIARCAECRTRADRVNDGRLANLGAAKRRLILSGAQRVAAFFLAGQERTN